MDKMYKYVRNLPSRAVVTMIKGYRECISPFMLPGKCRFIPSCSAYFMQAVEKYGAAKGSLLGIRRILKCHPFHKGGYDPLE